MGETPPFLADPDGTREEIMVATYHALRTHGYAGLTVQAIAEEFEKSKSLLYHHYDDKDELLLAFLAYMLEEFEAGVPDEAEEEPDERLGSVLDEVLTESAPPEAEQFLAVMVELRAQAANDERYEEQFTQHDRFFRENLAAAIREGVEVGTFRDVNPDRVAEFLVTLITGAMTRQVTSEGVDRDAVRREAERYVESTLRAEDTHE